MWSLKCVGDVESHWVGNMKLTDKEEERQRFATMKSAANYCHFIPTFGPMPWLKRIEIIRED